MIRDVLWYTGGAGSVGIVLVATLKGHKAYIGVSGGRYDADSDALHIAQWGAKFDHGPALWPAIETWAN